MGKRGPKPKGKVRIEWSPDFAYAIGLLVSDGNLSSDGRHITFTSKDKELIDLFTKALNITVRVGMKSRGGGYKERYYMVQFSDVLFYKFLLGIGLMPNKSKVIEKVTVPSGYFFDFLRGSYDGDGCTYSYFDKRWKSSFMFYTSFVSASRKHIEWLRHEVHQRLGVRGHVSVHVKKSVYQLRYAKKDSMKLFGKMWQNKSALSLTRKRLKINKILRTIGRRPQ